MASRRWHGIILVKISVTLFGLTLNDILRTFTQYNAGVCKISYYMLICPAYNHHRMLYLRDLALQRNRSSTRNFRWQRYHCLPDLGQGVSVCWVVYRCNMQALQQMLCWLSLDVWLYRILKLADGTRCYASQCDDILMSLTISRISKCNYNYQRKWYIMYTLKIMEIKSDNYVSKCMKKAIHLEFRTLSCHFVNKAL
jgi:hypothetical protein